MSMKHYGRVAEGATGVAQVDASLCNRSSINISEQILRLAHAEYEKQYPGQDYERMQERHGLSILEIIGLLADHVERLGGKPSAPRTAQEKV